MFFYISGGEHGETGVTRLHRFPYQIRQNPYSESIVWGTKDQGAKAEKAIYNSSR